MHCICTSYVIKVLTILINSNHTMYIVSGKQILNNPDRSSQDEMQTGRPQSGLRILARLIARDLLARRSTLTKENATGVKDKRSMTDN